MVDDLQAALDKAQELGGKTLVPPVESPREDGNTVGIFKPK